MAIVFEANYSKKLGPPRFQFTSILGHRQK